MERHGEIIDSLDGFGQRTYLAKAADGLAHIGEGSFNARLHRFCIERSAVRKRHTLTQMESVGKTVL